MSAILLRKLTRKSTVGFGKYSVMKIQELLNANKYAYLRWMYYCCSGIDFADESIFKELSIVDRIAKPGINKELFQNLMDDKQVKITGLLKHINTMKHNKAIRARVKILQTDKRYSKSSLARFNHGHR